MREIVFKNLNSGDRKKLDISISETVCQKGFFAQTQRRSQYFIIGEIEMGEFKDTNRLIVAKWGKRSVRPNHSNLIKVHDAKLHADKFVYKTAGNLYAALEGRIFLIHFVHVFKMDVINGSVKPKAPKAKEARDTEDMTERE